MNTNSTRRVRRTGLAAAAIGTSALVTSMLAPSSALGSEGTDRPAARAAFTAPTRIGGNRVVSVGAWRGSARKVVFTRGTRVPGTGKVILVGTGPKTENGLLAKVVAVSRAANGQVVASTKRAPIQAALPTGSYPFHTSQGAAQVTLAERRVTGAAARSDANNIFPLSFTSSCKPSVKNVHTDGQFTLNASLTGHAVIRLGFMGIDGTLHVADDAALHAALDAAASCNLNFIVAKAVFPLEGLGVPASLTVDLRLDATAALNGHAEIGVQHHFAMTRTVEWHTGEAGVQVFDGPTDNRGFTFDRPTLNGDAKVEAGLNLGVGINILEILNPHVDLRGYVGIRANTNTAPWWTAYDGLMGTAGIRLFGAELANPPLTLFKDEHVIARAVDAQPLLPQQSNVAAGAPYRQHLTGAGGSGGPYRFELASGTLPAGLTLSSDGTISGTPAKVGGDKQFPFQVRVIDGSGQVGDRPRDQTITVHDGPVAAPVTISAHKGKSISRQLAAIGAGPLHWSPSAPTPGYSLTDGGLLTGTVDGDAAFDVTVTDANGLQSTMEVTVIDLDEDPICVNPRLPGC